MATLTTISIDWDTRRHHRFHSNTQQRLLLHGGPTVPRTSCAVHDPATATAKRIDATSSNTTTSGETRFHSHNQQQHQQQQQHSEQCPPNLAPTAQTSTQTPKTLSDPTILSRFVTAVVHHLLNRLPSPSVANIPGSYEYERSVRSVTNLLNSIQSNGGLTFTAMVAALVLVRRVALVRRSRSGVRGSGSVGSRVSGCSRTFTLAGVTSFSSTQCTTNPASTVPSNSIPPPPPSACIPSIPPPPSETPTTGFAFQIGSTYLFKPLQIGAEPVLYSIALLISHKFTEDFAYGAKGWSKFSSLPAPLIANLEREYMDYLGWNIDVGVEEFGLWRKWLITVAEGWGCSETILDTLKSLNLDDGDLQP